MKTTWGGNLLIVGIYSIALNIFFINWVDAQVAKPRRHTWGTNGDVYAIAHTEDTIYLGGAFTHVAMQTGQGVPVSLETGLPDLNYPMVNATVRASVSDGNDGWFIGEILPKLAQSRAIA